MSRILLVEDDPAIRRSLSDFLCGEGYETQTAAGAQKALRLFAAEDWDVVLLDITLPDGDGFSVCREMKRQKDTPVIFLTASGEEHSVVAGLEMGADDYIAKPFRPRELISRIRAVLRRSRKPASVVRLGSVSVDVDKGAAYRDGKDLCLSALEYRLLLVFINNRDRILTRERLLEEIWDAAGDYVNDNTLTVYIRRLRGKIEDDPQNPSIIRTVRGMGYRLGGGRE